MVKTHAAMIAVTLGCLVLGGAGCSSDDPTATGGTGTTADGEEFVIPPFKVLLHGIDLQDVWKDGQAMLSVGGLGKAIFITDAGRFMLPTAETVRMYGTWFQESGAVFVVGHTASGDPTVLHYSGGLRYNEEIDGMVETRGVYGMSGGIVYVLAQGTLWRGPSSLGWTRVEVFPLNIYAAWSQEDGATFVAGTQGIFSNESPPQWDLVYESKNICVAVDGINPDKIMALDDDVIIVREGDGEFEVVFAAGTTLRDVCWAAPDWAVAVGDAGAIASYDGASWSLRHMDTPHALQGVTAWKEGEQSFAMAVGNRGSEYRYAGGDWTGGYVSNTRWQDLMGGATGSALYGIQGGQLMKYDGAVVDVPTPGDLELSDLYCTDEDSLWVIGKSDIDTFLARYEDGQWFSSWVTSMNIVSDIWVADRENVFVACDYGTIYQSEPQGGMAPVTAVQPVQHLHGIWGASAKSVYVVGDNGTISHYDGSQWTGMTSGASAHLRAVWGASDTHVVAVGDGGAVLRWNGSSWQAMNPGVDVDLTTVWTNGPDDIWVASTEDVLVHYTGGSWEVVPTGLSPAGIHALWGRDDDLWIAGGSGFLLEYVDPSEVPDLVW